MRLVRSDFFLVDIRPTVELGEVSGRLRCGRLLGMYGWIRRWHVVFVYWDGLIFTLLGVFVLVRVSNICVKSHEQFCLDAASMFLVPIQDEQIVSLPDGILPLEVIWTDIYSVICVCHIKRDYKRVSARSTQEDDRTLLFCKLSC